MAITFDKSSSAAIARAVQKVLREPTDKAGINHRRAPRRNNIFLASIDEVGTADELGQFSWTEQNNSDTPRRGRKGTTPAAGMTYTEGTSADMGYAVCLNTAAQFQPKVGDIVWIQAQFADDGTPAWNIVEFRAPPGIAIIVSLTKDGGSDGSDSGPCTYTYTATDADGNTAGTALTPTAARSNGSFIPATIGIGYWSGTATSGHTLTFHLAATFDELPNLRVDCGS